MTLQPSEEDFAELPEETTIRKNSLCNRGDNGATVQGVLMSVYRTLRLRGLDPLETIVSALRDGVRAGSLTPSPSLRTPDS